MNSEDRATEGPTPEAPARNPVLELLLVGVLLSIVTGVGIAVTWKLRIIHAGQRQQNPQVLTSTPDGVPSLLPDFSLVDTDGKPVTRDDLKGHVWVANFFFTNCPAQCPMMNQRMAQIQRALPDGAAARLVSITVDPERDSPEILRDYAKTYGAKDGRWLFLTGDKQAIIQLALEGFKLPAGENPNDHSLRLALIDRDGRIRGYFNSTEDDSIASLQAQLLSLLTSERP